MTFKLELPEQKLSGLETKLAIATALAASVFLALTPVLIRISESFLSPNATIFNRFWIATVILGLWNGLFLQNRQTNPPVKDSSNTKRLFVPLLVLVIAFVSTQLLWAWSLAQTTVANSEILHCLSPGFTTLAGWLLFAQRFGGRFLIGMVVATGGTIAIGVSDMSHSSSLFGDGLALLSAVFWAAYIMSMEKLRNYLSPTIIVMWASGSCTLLCLPVMLIAGDEVLPYSAGAWLTLIVLALNTVVCHSLVAYAIKWLSSGLMSTILLLSPVLTAVVAWALFSETLSPLNLLGFAVIMVGVYLAISDEGELKIPED
ncbi:MAG: DMT family transporter [Tychonema bourrellyi B0820]|uniref:EamA family transporter n=1 Tax=Tychonema bourrellyi FEM_GT703 TaxID=2040638 RepID=A0A2G4F3Z0_9CYAN|nr:DMT family transporter [Tychonema bourrellyi]MDQ2096315.1 DMT family transporter [Tychonema bourrellyi B0820]PHX56480.1 EamA family transporter [Tychonema bourrellyi FEM_GT703]